MRSLFVVRGLIDSMSFRLEIVSSQDGFVPLFLIEQNNPYEGKQVVQLSLDDAELLKDKLETKLEYFREV